jgi:quercetin dioxygenase-like cupin family protein
VPIEVRRFGVGHRRPEGPPGTTGIQGQVIETSPAGVIAELAFGRNARITPHSNPNSSWFIVIEGGGWVGVGDERTRIQAGEAVAWPADVLHAAWTEGTHMRAIVVEFAPPTLALPVVHGEALALDAGERPAAPGGQPEAAAPRPVSRGEGGLAPTRRTPPAGADADAAEGEPR